MSRPVILSNGQLAVGLNEYGLVQDFYYPYVGLDNLTNARLGSHKLGVWVDGNFSWAGDDGWDISVNIESDALISHVSLRNEWLGIQLTIRDTVDHQRNIFGRHITVENQHDNERDIRIFMHQIFQISRSGRADTALYVPDDHYILDYKGRCSLLISGKFSGEDESFDQYAVGNFGIEGKEGTWRDAEDGDLSGSAVEHGGVDSVIRFRRFVSPHSSMSLDYWIAASDSQFSAEKLHNKMKSSGVYDMLQLNRDYWADWLAIGANSLHAIQPEYLPLAKKSLMLIKAHIDKRGGVIASCDSSIYNYGRDYYSYVWPRDGAYVIWPLIRLGHYKEAKDFFQFCRDIITDDGYLMHKYQPDKSIGSTWHPLLHNDRKELAIQEDESAIVLYMLGEYYHYSGDKDFVLSLYETLIRPMADFMCSFIDEKTGLPHASYDLWEEKFLTNTYSVAVVYQSLLVAADFAEQFEHPEDAVKWRSTSESLLNANEVFYYQDRQHYRKGYILSPEPEKKLQFDNTLDISSMYGVMMFGYYTDKSKLDNTVKAIEKYLFDKSPAGGTPRYEHDQYFTTDPPYMGNPWFVTTFWLAQYYIRAGMLNKAESILSWSMTKTLQSGVFSEQVNPGNGAPLSVAPLVWSHAEFINTVLDYSRSEQNH
ncbi:glycoside hydrolase family 15 protein [soil metagenome]